MTIHSWTMEDQVVRNMIFRAIEVCYGNRTQAAELLGLTVRTMRNKLRWYKSLGMMIPAAPKGKGRIKRVVDLEGVNNLLEWVREFEK
jgi:Bacterial regulatory protein, Fis family